MRRCVCLAALIAALVVLAGCSGNDRSPDRLAAPGSLTTDKAGSYPGILPEVTTFVKPTDTFAVSSQGEFGDDWLEMCSGQHALKLHTGVDVDLRQVNKPVKASADGVVIYAGSFGKGWGSCVIVEHDLFGTGRYTTLYGHIKIAAGIAYGTPVTRGTTVLGTIDPAISPPHLHFGVRQGKYDRSLSHAGALRQCGYAACGPLFPERWKDPVLFLEQRKPRPPLTIVTNKSWLATKGQPTAWYELLCNLTTWRPAAVSPTPPIQPIIGLEGTSAQPIWNATSGEYSICCVRKSFQLPIKPWRARCVVSADDAYTLAANGMRVANDSGGGAWAQAETVDITRNLHAGDNFVAVRGLDTAGGGRWILAEVRIEF